MAKTLRFSKGDRVEITKNLSYHGFNIGEVVEIYAISTSVASGLRNGYWARTAKASWFITDDECKLATKQPQVNMSTTGVDALRKALVLQCAQTMCKANNTITTLEIKDELRKTQPAYNWRQHLHNGVPGVSEIMAEFVNSGVFNVTADNGTYRTYSLVGYTKPTKTRSHKTTARVVSVKVKSTKKATKKAKSTSTTNWTPNSTITRKSALNLMRNNKGHFFSVLFEKQEDGSLRTMNCQYLPGQTPSDTYVKVKEASLVRAGDPNPIRQFRLDSVKLLSIAKNTYKIRGNK